MTSRGIKKQNLVSYRSLHAYLIRLNILGKKLWFNYFIEYAFQLYDIDKNGTLDLNELNAVIYGMLDMLGADRKGHSAEDLAKECMDQLDINHDGLISKDEFISGLLTNHSLRGLMSPFN